MTDPPRLVVTRFAPSPTGRLHIGGARTALFNWALARHLNGRFMLRIEDTDRARSSDQSTRRILEDLAWLGIDWDEGPQFDADGRTLGGDPRSIGPFFQSERLAHYQKYIHQLLEQDLAYHAFETPDELDEMRHEARRDKRPFRYNRAALEIPRDERFARARAGEPCAVRFLTPDETVTVHDLALGDVAVAGSELGDFVIQKADGFPTYHFAVVVDDQLMGVTHVVRGQEHLINTPRHILLQRALGFATPIYTHLSLIFNIDGSKMSKRDKDKAVRKACRDAGLTEPPAGTVEPAEFTAWLGDKNHQLAQDDLHSLAGALRVELPAIDVEDFRDAGYLPEVICNYIALLGFSPGEDVEKFDMAFLAERFEPARLGKTNARFDYQKLKAFNTDALCEMTDDEFADRWWRWCAVRAPELLAALGAQVEPGARFGLLAAATRPRCKTFSDAVQGASFVCAPDDAVVCDAKAVKKTLLKNNNEGLETLRLFLRELERVDPWTLQSLHEAIASFAQARGIGMGKVAQPLRVALTGQAVSPPIDATLAVLGKESALARIARRLAALDSACSNAT